jgi:hypothetical protein
MTITAPAEQRRSSALIYRFEGQLAEPYPVGRFDDGIRFHNDFEGTVVDGPFAGGRIFGLDQFMIRADGVGFVDAPEVIEVGDVRVSVHVRGYVVPPAGTPVPSLDDIADPDFAFPDVPFRFTGCALLRTAHPHYASLNATVAVLEGTVNMGTGRLEVEARAADLR